MSDRLEFKHTWPQFEPTVIFMTSQVAVGGWRGVGGGCACMSVFVRPYPTVLSVQP